MHLCLFPFGLLSQEPLCVSHYCHRLPCSIITTVTTASSVIFTTFRLVNVRYALALIQINYLCKFKSDIFVCVYKCVCFCSQSSFFSSRFAAAKYRWRYVKAMAHEVGDGGGGRMALEKTETSGMTLEMDTAGRRRTIDGFIFVPTKFSKRFGFTVLGQIRCNG